MLVNSVFSVPAVAVNTITLRAATLADAEEISALVNLGEREGQLIPRSLDSIRASVGDWIVAENHARIIGVGSLVEMGPTLSEVRSLAVAPEYRKFGIGAKLVAVLTDLARERVVRFVPPLIFEKKHMDELAEKLAGILAEVG